MSAPGESELAKALHRRGLGAPARLLLDAHRPLRPLLAELSAFMDPLLGSLLGRHYARTRRVLDDPDAYDAIIEELADAEHR